MAMGRRNDRGLREDQREGRRNGRRAGGRAGLRAGGRADREASARCARRAPRVSGIILATFAAVVAALATLAAPPTPAAAQRSLVFERFHAEVEVQPSGDLLVTETLRPRFTGQWNGILRHINRGHTTAGGDRVRFQLDFLSATDERGRQLEAEVNRIDGDTREFRVWVPNARDRTAEVTIRYRVRGVIRYFAGAADEAGGAGEPAGAAATGAGGAAQSGETGPPGATEPAADYDELYWQITGTEWDVPIEEASARVVLPPGAEVIQAAAYQGGAGSSDRAALEIRRADETGAVGGEVVVQPTGRLRPGQGVTVAVAWPAGHVAVPAGTQRSRPVQFGPGGSVPVDARRGGPMGSASYLALLPLLLPLIVFRFAYRAWDQRGRDPKERAIAVRWEPPADLTPAEAGTLVDHDPGMHDILSTLVDLAVRGYLVIAEREKKGFLKFGKDYAFHLVRPRSEWQELSRHESLFLNGLFLASEKSEVLANLATQGSLLDGVLETVAGEPAANSAPPGALDSVLLSDLQNKFYKKIPGIKEALLDSLVAKGHYLKRPDRVRTRWGLMTVGVLLLGFASIPAFASATATGAALGVVTLIAAGSSGLILGVFTFLMPARTQQGARTREATLGFKRFLERVESPRYRRMIQSPDQFEKYLPFAMAFRCADKWATAFDDLLSEPPDWYHGHHGGFRATSFASDLGTMASTASSTMSSSPSSSSGSGGGGSVGGGSGGGGGGGF